MATTYDFIIRGAKGNVTMSDVPLPGYEDGALENADSDLSKGIADLLRSYQKMTTNRVLGFTIRRTEEWVPDHSTKAGDDTWPTEDTLKMKMYKSSGGSTTYSYKYPSTPSDSDAAEQFGSTLLTVPTYTNAQYTNGEMYLSSMSETTIATY